MLLAVTGCLIVWSSRRADSDFPMRAPAAKAMTAVEMREDARPMAPATPSAVAPVETFESVAAEWAALSAANQREEANRRLQRLAKLDPLRALGLVATLPANRQDSARTLVLGTWLRSEPRLAFAWAQANYPFFFQMREFADAAVELRDITLVEDGLLARPDGFGKQVALRNLTLAWAKVDPAFMTRWTQGLAARGVSGLERDYATAGLLQALARDAPEEALRWIEQSTPFDNNSRRRQFQAVALGLKDAGRMDEAEKLFSGHPENRDYNLAFNVIVADLAARAPERVERIIAGMEPLFRSAVLGEAAGTIAKTQPDYAARLWLNYDPEINRLPVMKSLQVALTAWAARDRDAALRAIDQAERLSPENRQKLREVVLIPPAK